METMRWIGRGREGGGEGAAADRDTFRLSTDTYRSDSCRRYLQLSHTTTALRARGLYTFIATHRRSRVWSGRIARAARRGLGQPLPAAARRSRRGPARPPPHRPAPAARTRPRVTKFKCHSLFGSYESQSV